MVERDEQEAELRGVLNYGHTVGHALEAAPATPAGPTARRSRSGWRPRRGWPSGSGSPATATVGVRSACCAGGGPARPRARTCGAEPSSSAIGRDKKARDGRVPFVLAPTIGKFRLVFDVPPAAVEEALAAIA